MTLLFPKPLKREKKPKRLQARGKKVDAWEKVRSDLKARFEAAGIVQCELGYEGCWKNNALSFAHSKKRRKIEGDEISETCLSCVPCHMILENKKDMTEIVRSVIARRKVKV